MLSIHTDMNIKKYQDAFMKSVKNSVMFLFISFSLSISVAHFILYK